MFLLHSLLIPTKTRNVKKLFIHNLHLSVITASQGWVGVDFDVAATHFVWCQSSTECAITNSFGDPLLGDIVSERKATVLEFCMNITSMTSHSKVAYFQGKVINDTSKTIAASPNSYFYGYCILE